MPIEREFGELDLWRIQQGCKRMAKRPIVWIVAAIEEVSMVIERRRGLY